MARRVRLPLLAAVLALLNLPAASAGPDVTVLGLFSGKAVLEIAGQRRVLSEGERSPEGVRLVKADSEAAVLEIDGRQERYPLGTHIGSSYSASAQREVRIWPDAVGMYTVNGAINRYSVVFMVDTGATSIAMNSHQARRLGIDYLQNGVAGRVETASGRETAYRVTLDRVSVGEIKLHNVPAVVLEGELPSRILLGMSFLGRLDMQRDGQALVLRTRW